MRRHIAIVMGTLLCLGLNVLWLTGVGSARAAEDGSAKKPAAATSDPSGRTIEIKVVDGKTRAALEGVTLKSDGATSGASLRVTKKTDATGVAALKLSDRELSYLHIS